VADGHLALAVVSEHALGNVRAALARRGLAARSSSVWWCLASTPNLLTAVLAILALAGVGAGLFVSSLAALATAIAWVGIWLLGQLYLTHPVTADRDRRSWLDPEDESVVANTLTSLPKGRAKSLLVDVVRLGRILYSRAKTAEDTSVTEDTAALILVAAEVATDLANVHELADALTRRDAIRRSHRNEPDASVRLLASAAQLEGLLLNAIGYLGGGTRRLLNQGRSGNRLNFLIHEIDRGRSASRGTFQEIERLLAARRGA
jgi:hypothetical protein